MNQILFENNNNNNDYNKIDTKKIVIFFCIALICIAVIIVSIKLVGMYKNSKDNKNGAVPDISIIKENDKNNEVTIKATCEDGIDYLIYTWNNENENKVNLNGSKTFERIIEIPDNVMNNLAVKVVSTQGVNNNKTEIFEKNTNNIKPTIDSISIIDKKLHIQVSDDTGLAYILYRWENEGEQKISADENDNKTMNVELDIQRGTYKLFVTVVDVDGNEENVSRLITGVNEPQITVIKYGGVVNISVTHDRGFKRIEYIINNKKYVYDEAFTKYDKNKTTVEFEFPLKEGENIVKVSAYSWEKLSEEDEVDILENYSSKTFIGKCTYEP